ncbi:hypothetical protein [Breznakiella homolactica]|uniref:Uncharacterized protein n=1 Tax=Breznakiella homolactica TaxID=2798577 RepID=A0A7T7XQD5_9SPIR|nr:hypothetical protein [Breznakiella homolactica]QQO10572.1 hypothetical protein JFL75_06565 [Breznakiella homolactica]
MKKLKCIIETVLDKISDILLPLFVIGMFVLVFYEMLPKEETLGQTVILLLHNIKKNIILLISSIILGTFFALLLIKIKRNKNNIFFPKMDVLYIFLAFTILMILILIRSNHPATLLIPFVFLLLIIQGMAEYYKIDGEMLYVKRGIGNKPEVINIKDISSIGLLTDKSGEGSETFIVIYLYNNQNNNQMLKLRENIENRNLFIRKLLEINKNISIPVYDTVNFKKNGVTLGKYIYDDLLNGRGKKILEKILLASVLIAIFSIDFYILLRMITNK